jgi:hypothetical protein
LSERGAAHEQSYVEHLLKAGLDVVRIAGIEVTNTAIPQTLAAMQHGVPVIVQAALSHQGWNGRADILRGVEVSSAWAVGLMSQSIQSSREKQKQEQFSSSASIPTC